MTDREQTLDDRCFINGGGFALDGKTHLTGAQIRALPTPSIRDTDDLYMEVPYSEDVIVRYDEVVPVAGRRFFSVPQIINAGSGHSERILDESGLKWESYVSDDEHTAAKPHGPKDIRPACKCGLCILVRQTLESFK